MTRFADYIHTPVCDLLACRYPIVQAGMGGVARAELVSAVIEAGAYGYLGMVREPAEFIRRQIRKVRERSSRPFGVNLIPAATDARLLDAQIRVCLEEQIASICLFWDIDAKVVRRFTDAGILVAYQVGSLRDALAAADAGADILIVQGFEAGGHVRGTQTLFTLLPEIADATSLPLIASGGIVDGRGMLAAMSLGAQGVHCGTLFLASDESNAHDFHKARLIESRSEDTLHTTVFHINWPAAAPVRVLQNSTSRGEHTEADKIIAFEAGRALPLYSTDSPLQETTGQLEAMALYAGQGVSLIREIKPAVGRVKDLLEQVQSLLQFRRDIKLPDLELPTLAMPEEVSLSSSPCSLAELDDVSAGYLGNHAVLAFMAEFLNSTRTITKVLAHSLKLCKGAEQQKMLREMHADYVCCANKLAQLISTLDGKAEDCNEAPFRSLIGNTTLNERLIQLYEQQANVLTTLNTTLPLVRNTQLNRQLRQLRQVLDTNIAKIQGAVPHSTATAG